MPDGNGLRAAVGIRNALLLAPVAWGALVAFGAVHGGGALT